MNSAEKYCSLETIGNAFSFIVERVD